MKTKQIWGTNHFPSIAAAISYYRDFGGEPNANGNFILGKIQAKEICIGEPTPKKNEKVFLNIEEGRYFLIEFIETK